ncbi:MAG: hypothetical protein HY815_16515 [Candidatus Riflebacteria bacterium]|nr:hypothetical protein [Candidatus Riflebacteria bacterium]
MALIGFAFTGFLFEAGVREATQNFEAEKAKLPGAAEVQKILLAYRDLRGREVGVDARFAYVSELLKNRMGWGRFFASVERALPRAHCCLTAVDVQTQWPHTGDGSRGGQAKGKTVWFTLRGEARSLTGVTQFLQALKQARLFKAPRITSSRPASAAPGSAGSAAYAFEIIGEIDSAHSQEN